jgi:hypothetical protein
MLKWDCTQDVGCVGCLHSPLTETLAPPTTTFRGYPDLMCRRRHDGITLILIEIKRPLILTIADGTFADIYNQGTNQSARFALHQILGYLWCNGYRYGILSTMQQTWFLRQTDRAVEMSPTITIDSQDPTLIQAYLWFIRQADTDSSSITPPPTNQEVQNMVDPEGGDSDFGIFKKFTKKFGSR